MTYILDGNSLIYSTDYGEIEYNTGIFDIMDEVGFQQNKNNYLILEWKVRSVHRTISFILDEHIVNKGFYGDEYSFWESFRSDKTNELSPFLAEPISRDQVFFYRRLRRKADDMFILFGEIAKDVDKELQMGAKSIEQYKQRMNS